MLVTDLPKDKHYRYFEAAVMAAFLCPGIGHNDFRLGAVIRNKKYILTAKYNTGKTHPILAKFSEFPFLCSESNAIISLGLDNCKGTVLYVARVLKNKELAIAKPCKRCQYLIDKVGIKSVYYTTGDGYESL